MIIDTLENLEQYASVNPRFAKAIEYLKSTDLNAQEPGKVELDGKDLVVNFSIAKEWQGFDPASANNGDAWTASLIDHYKQGEFNCTVTWDYSEANKIVVRYSFAWEDAIFNQQYTITPLSGNLLNTYSIGLGVDYAYYHVTGMTVE